MELFLELQALVLEAEGLFWEVEGLLPLEIRWFPRNMPENRCQEPSPPYFGFGETVAELVVDNNSQNTLLEDNIQGKQGFVGYYDSPKATDKLDLSLESDSQHEHPADLGLDDGVLPDVCRLF